MPFSAINSTTVGGVMPLVLPGGDFWPPFAVAIAGGTVLTTLLSFYFIAAAFLLMSRYKPFEQTEGEENLKKHRKTRPNRRFFCL